MLLERRFNDELPESELTGMERAYKAFGLVPASMDLRKFMLELLTEQVAGYYDPKAKTLYVVEGGDEAVTGIAFGPVSFHHVRRIGLRVVQAVGPEILVVAGDGRPVMREDQPDSPTPHQVGIREVL